ncbi:putative membrane protein YeiB [Haloactinospora alba]|uniref:Putative membrane protein YeiB n=1 Tax=Haloactinospora alba TaxID=405555 RepID=A0A543NL12_9ACTN|nr:heparan-alpha-glucosaminide N-acetyltransferase domain-containing protein [Haloactinospora alba]TQN32496.1 putative membrane protein YeiB [Haloactinospora alba]
MSNDPPAPAPPCDNSRTHGSEAATPRSRPQRLAGIDLARFLAIAGMLVVHFGTPFIEFNSPTSAMIFQYANGRSTVLFAFLAGISLSLLSRAPAPPRQLSPRRRAARIAVRGAALMVVGWLLNAVVVSSGSGLTVIITYYGLFFLLAVPFLRWSGPWLAAAAGVVLLVGPQVRFLVRRSYEDGGAASEVVRALNSYDPGHLFYEQGLAELTVFGLYPALCYMAAVFAGMAVGRLDLRDPAVRLRLAVFGMPMAFVAYRVSWHAWYHYGLYDVLGRREEVTGPVPTDDARWLLSNMPHTATTFEVAGAIGIAMTVLAGCLWLAERVPRLLAPFTTCGAMALTIYVTHALVLSWQAWLRDDIGGLLGLLDRNMGEVYVVTALVGATLYRAVARRGPLEAGVSAVTTAAVPERGRRGRRSPPLKPPRPPGPEEPDTAPAEQAPVPEPALPAEPADGDRRTESVPETSG